MKVARQFIFGQCRREEPVPEGLVIVARRFIAWLRSYNPSETESDKSLTGQQTGPEHISAKATSPWAFLEDEDEDESGVVNGGKLDPLPWAGVVFFRKFPLALY